MGIMDWIFNGSGPKVEKFLDGSRQKITLISKQTLSRDSYLLRFDLNNPNYVLGLPIVKHIRFYCPNQTGKVEGYWNGKPTDTTSTEISRKYTPISKQSDKGYVDFVIKMYLPMEDGPYVDGGKMSRYLHNLTIGDELEIDGPVGMSEYLGKGKFFSKGHEFSRFKIGMIAGGSGITPFYQLIQAILNDPSEDNVTLSLLYANQSENDILLKEELDTFQKLHPDKFKVAYTVDKADNKWQQYVGYVNEKMISETLPAPSDDTAIFFCGPPPMVEKAIMPSVRNLGYNMDYVMKL
uniref:NADH-cytochrome b5 reductase n=1 Tax=Nephromyces sp. MMRI TaxID=2496275 RepID=A0A3S8V308_9APIC|nr:NADH-dependent fumarate reductase [Nephromyces sp. MMRI]AZL94381.1 NADH-dependent fumarate reductase [Nephromyces sp. MMRI]